MLLCKDVYRYDDTCNVYVLVNGTEALLIDFGSGDVLEHLGEYGVERVTDVVMTHHHRDQGQGLARAAASGIRVWVPPVERDLFGSVDEHWQRRGVDNYMDLRQDRFSLIAPVRVYDTVPEYRTRRIGGFDVTTVPTPGHTTGSVSYLIDVGEKHLAFTGDLIYGSGQLWSLAATQWTYSGREGIAATVLSLKDIVECAPQLVLPSHGAPISDISAAVANTEPKLRKLLDMFRAEPWDLDAWRDRPFERLSPHLLVNRTSNALSYVLLSDSGGALLFDFGYDMVTGWTAGEDRAARRPWLASLRSLKRDFGVERVETAIPTHYHDDHVAGLNLLRDVERTEVWAEEGIAAIMADPAGYDLPCLYHDPIRTDRVLHHGAPIRWREYELAVYPLPGHCHHAVAIAVDVDGQLVLATGDQQDGRWAPGGRPELLNFQYKNGFEPDDFVASAKLYLDLHPDLILSGHWGARRVDDAYLNNLLVQGQTVARLHRQLLGRDELDVGAGDFLATMRPYQSSVTVGQSIDYAVEVANPLDRPARMVVLLVLPDGWAATPREQRLDLAPKAKGTVAFSVRPRRADGARRRAVVAADLSVDGRRLGQHAEALVDIHEPTPDVAEGGGLGFRSTVDAGAFGR